MEDVQDFGALGARPRRHVRPPIRYGDYELDLKGMSTTCQEKEREWMSRLEGSAKKTPLTSPYATPLRPQLNRDVFLHETDTYYAARKQHEQEEQLAQQLYSEGQQDELWDHLTPHHTPYHTTPQAAALRVEMQEIQHERILLQQSQRRMAADLADLRAIRTDMLQLMNSARNCQPAREPNYLDQDNDDQEEDWPPPPPSVSEEEEALPSSNLCLLERLDKMMSDLQVLKKDAVMGKQDRLLPKQAPPISQAHEAPRANYSNRKHIPEGMTLQHPPWSGQAPLPPVSASTPYDAPGNPSAVRPQFNEYPSLPQRLPYSSSPLPAYSRPSYQHNSLDTAYHGPRPTIPNLTHRDPGEFAHLKIALENLLPPDSTELFKYQVLTDHLKLEEAKLVADAYIHSLTPFTDTMMALNEKFGQPHQLALKGIATVMDSPDIRRGDVAAFDKFSLQIQSLVGMLKTLGPEGEVELRCGSHVARLLSKLPPEQRADFRRSMFSHSGHNYTLNDLAAWLKYESWCQDFDGQLYNRGAKDRQSGLKPEVRPGKRSVVVLHGADNATKEMRPPHSSPPRGKQQPYCAFCDNRDHHLSQCTAILRLNKDQLAEWIKINKRCWRCARSHHAAQCNLKKPCNLCRGRHLQVLHDVNTRPRGPTQAAMSQDGGESSTEVLYLDRPSEGSRVLLKVVPVLLHHGSRTLETYAV